STSSLAEAPQTTVSVSEERQNPPVNSSEQLSDPVLAELAIEARYLLDRANANLGEQVSVTKTSEKHLLVRALVESEQRKAELLAALAPLRAKPGIILDVATYAEVQDRQPSQPTKPLIVSEAEITQRQIPVSAELRRYFAAQIAGTPQIAGARGPDAWIEEQVARFANRIQGLAAGPLRHAWALNNLIEQVST